MVSDTDLLLVFRRTVGLVYDVDLDGASYLVIL